MASFNKVILLGNLTRDPELRFTQGGSAVCHFGMALNRRYKTQEGDWKEEVTFVDVTIWGKRGEAFAQYHSKGKQAFLEGELRLDTWEDKNGGGKRSKLYVVANNWEFVGGGGGPRGGDGDSQGGGRDAEPAWGAPPADAGYQGGISDTPF